MPPPSFAHLLRLTDDTGLFEHAECYPTFLIHAQGCAGGAWGCALWGLGTAAARSPAPWIRDEALTAFTVGAARRSTHPRAMAFAGLEAAEILHGQPDNAFAVNLLEDAANTVGTPGETPQWPWPQPATCGGYDGPAPSGPNLNQGAESTLALISTLQHLRDLP